MSNEKALPRPTAEPATINLKHDHNPYNPAAVGAQRRLVDLRDWRHYRDVEWLLALRSPPLAELFMDLGVRALTRSEIDTIVTRYVTAFYRREARR
jgi:hypothetical protein